MKVYDFLLCTFAVLITISSEAFGLRVFRDSEIEHVVKKISAPMFLAANVDIGTVKVLVVDESSVNAYVSSNNEIFIHKGLLLLSREPSVVAGVIAHEIGHMAQNHVVKMESKRHHTMIAGGIGYVIGMIASLLTEPKVGQAIIWGSSTLTSRGFLAYSRAQEEVADQYALTYLDAAGYPNDGLMLVMKHLSRGENQFVDIDEYILTHPISEQRLRKLGNYHSKNKPSGFSNEDIIAFQRVVEKTEAFLMPIEFFEGKELSPYIQSILSYRKASTEEALKQLEALIKSSAADPYLHEIRAQIFYKLGRIEESVVEYKAALDLFVEDPLIRLGLAQALMLKDPREALQHLEQVSYQDKGDPFIWKQLAVAYGRVGNVGMSYFSLANRFFIEGNNVQFVKYAELSKRHLAKGSVQLQIIEDMEKAHGS